MIKTKKMIFIIIFVAFFTSLLFVFCDFELNVNAAEITDTCTLNFVNKDGLEIDKKQSSLLDGKYTTYSSFSEGDVIKIKSEKSIFSLYIIWDRIPNEWKYIVNGNEYKAGQYGYLHEYINVFDNVGQAVNEIDIVIPKDIPICDIYAFTDGELPEWVQVWQTPCEKADIMLLSTHSDDEQLFFAGVLPYYAGEIGAAVQVVYLTNYWDFADEEDVEESRNRPHEQINGLWTVGMKNYPIIGPFPDDTATLSQGGENVQETLERVLAGKYDETGKWSEANLIEFQVEMIRRFKPQVIVAHDINGEYQHGAHIANTDTMMKALAPAADATQYTEIADLYGVWDVPKVYIHLYEENPIDMNWDIPLDKFGGKTAFEVSKEGYGCHYSQHWTWFTRWINNGTRDEDASPVSKASEFTLYSPCKYGLYRTLVGNDTKADFLDNIVMYKDQIVEDVPEQTNKPILGTTNPEDEIHKNDSAEKKGEMTSLQEIVVYCIITVCCIVCIIALTVFIRRKYK